MKLTLSALGALSLSGLAAAAPAQEEESLRWDWTVDLDAPGIFTHSAAGDLDGDGRSDAVVLDGQKVVVLFRPAGGMAPSEIAYGAKGSDVLPGSAPGGGASVLWTDATGLHSSWWDGSQFTSSLVAAGPWAGAAAVRAADIDGDGWLDAIGLSADRRTLLLMRRPTGSAASFEATVQVASDFQVRDLAALRYTGSVESQFALLSDWGLQIVSSTGQVVHQAAAVLPGGAIAVLREPGADRLAWIQDHASGGQQWLIVLALTGTEQVLGLGAPGVVAASAGDVDADGDCDLVLSHKSDHTLLGLENLRSASNPLGARFSLTAGVTVSRVGPQLVAPDNRAWPALSDFDGDGDLDALLGVQSTREIRVVLSELVDQRAASFSFVSASISAASGASTSTLHLSLAAPTAQLDAPQVEVLLWRQASVSGLMEPVPLHHQLLTWQGSLLQLDLPIPENGTSFSAVYGIEVRRVASATGHVFPSLHLAYVANALLASELVLLTPDAETVAFISNAMGNNSGVMVRRPAEATWARNMPPQSPPQTTGGN